MPYPNHHACRMRDPGDFVPGSMRTVKKENAAILIGKLKSSGNIATQSIRYPVDKWTESGARAQCEKNKGIMFEPAEPTSNHSAVFDPVPVEISDADFDLLIDAGEIEPIGNFAQITGGNVDELPTREIIGVEIFAAGTWTDMYGHRHNVTAADLDEMVANFNRLRNHVKPTLRLLHTSNRDQMRLTARPAVGWFKNLYRRGTKLVADIANVPLKIAELVKAGAYRRISAEIAFTFYDESNKRRFKNVVVGAALLGHEMPAVNTLADVANLYSIDPGNITEFDYCESSDWNETITNRDDLHVVGFCFAEMSPDNTKPMKGGEKMTDDERKKMETMDERIRVLETGATESASKFATIAEVLGIDADGDVVDAVKSLKSANETLSNELSMATKKRMDAEIDAVFQHARDEKKFIPAHEPMLRSTFKTYVANADADGNVCFIDENGNEQNGSPADAMTAYFAAMPPMANMNENGEINDHTGGNEDNAGDDSVPPDIARYAKHAGIGIDAATAKIDAEIETLRSENDALSYPDAMKIVCAKSGFGANPKTYIPETDDDSDDDDDEVI